MRKMLVGLLGITVAGFGCSDPGAGGTGGSGDSGGTSGTAGSGAAGTQGTGAQTATGSGGSTNPAGTSGTGGMPAGAGGSGTGGGGTGTGGSSTGSGGTGGPGSGGAGRGGSNMGGAGGSGTGGSGTGGSGTGGSGRGGSASGGGGRGGAAGSGTGGSATGGGGRGGSGGSSGGGSSGGGTSGGTCTASQKASASVTGTGPHKVVIETNSAAGIKCGTIFRPEDLGGAEKYPIFVWGEGGCSQNGLSNQAAMGEIASWGYFVIADGTPNGTNACGGGQDGKAFLDYLTWSIAENGKSCSAYYGSLDTTKIAADGFSCGGLMSENVSGDARFTAIGITSSGLMGANATLYNKIHTPFKIMNGGSSDIAYENGLRDYQQISALGKPIIYFSKTSAGHGGDLGQARGDFNKVNLAWLNWQLKGDTGTTGKGYLTGSTCQICSNSGWVTMSANIQ
jgi:hypothetical protein